MFLMPIGILCLSIAASARDRVSRRVDTGPGTVAWSADSTELAWLVDGEVRVRELSSRQRRRLDGAAVRMVEWAPGEALLLVQADGAVQRRLPDGLALPAPETASPPAVGARWLVPDLSYVVVRARAEQTRIGLATEFTLERVAPDGVHPLGQWDPLLPTLSPVADYADGWVHSRRSPGAGTLVLPDHHDPPQDKPHIRLVELDPDTGESRVRGHLYLERGYFMASSWSEDGRLLAVADDTGKLRIFDPVVDKWALVSSEATGRFPSWSPTDPRIYLGGWLVGPDGSTETRLLRRAHDAVGTWSPDGKRLAVASERGLFVWDLPRAP